MGRLNLEAILEKNGIDFKHSDNSKEYRVCCPSCGDQKYRLWLNADKGVGICYRCTEGGSVWRFLRMFGIERASDTKKVLALPDDPIEIKPVAMPPDAVPLWKSNSIMAAKACEYLVGQRDLMPDDIEKYKIHYCYRGELSGNVILPIYDVDGETLLGWQARRFALHGKKSLNPIGSNGRLYGLPQAKGKWGLLIVEGPFDMIVAGRKLEESGIGVVALLGHSLAVNQAGIIRYVLAPEKVFVMLDPDAYADQQKIGTLLRKEGLDVTLCPKQRTDPDELSGEELLVAMEESVKIL